VYATILPIGGFASLVDPNVRRKSAIVENITGSRTTEDHKRRQNDLEK
jgi:hypothetical protein